MIRYEVDMAKLVAEVGKLDAKWMTKAEERTERFERAAKYSENSNQAIWSTVKPAFMALQHNKCVFCERQFENELYGKIEFDLEHFRPKSSVKVWPVAGLHSFVYDFPTGDASETGYYWLPYDLGNYAASCKACNTSLKSNYFPIAGDRLTSRGELKSEKSFLCYPLGTVDDDPQSLVTFIGTVAVPASASGHERRRGQVIIDFFDLNGREQLHRERARMIVLFGASLAAVAAGHADNSDQLIIETCRSSMMPHASCLRAFERQWTDDRAFARRVLSECKRYFTSLAGELPILLDH